jgi:alkanesulfonate monooxygenase SsuD/methylene tetrahydromethanopterin reductase-like flavin-dependent oxidoreductase (luciferase family)
LGDTVARIGYFLSSEEFSPTELVRQAKLAEAAGFEALAVSDHFHPWNDEQGHSGFVWATVGALSQVTRLPVSTSVTCPTVRIHPAVIATLPEQPVPVYVSAFGPQAAELAGRIGDGLVSTKADRDLLQTFRSSGGAGKPTQAGAKACWAPDEATGRKTAHRYWANSQLPGQLAQELPLPSHFEQASALVTEEMVTEEMVGEVIPCGPDPERHLASLQPYLDAGYDEVYVAQIGPQQEEFFAFYADHVLPRVQR